MNKKLTLTALVLVSTLFFTACKPNVTAEVDNKMNNATPISIGSIDEAYEVILTRCSREFIGGHAIDDSFLSWLGSVYGPDTVTEIASQGDYDNPEVWYQITGKSIHVLWDEFNNAYGFFLDQNVHELSTASGDEIVMDFTGDLSLADDIATTEYMLQRENGLEDCFSSDLLDEMRSADLLVINNEFTYTTRGEAIPGKAYTFRGDPTRVKELNKIGTDLVTLANNHVCDYGDVGLLDTLETLQNNNTPYIGAGPNIKEAMRPIYYIANGRKIAIVNATQIEKSYNYTKEATETTPGVLKSLNSTKFCKVIKEADQNADTVIALIHWGTEGNASYGKDQVKLANDFISAGADVIVGGHTHCLQGIEYMSGVPVYFSLGNYWFSTTSRMPADYDTGLAKIRIKNDGTINCEFVPCKFSFGVTSMVHGQEKADIINRLKVYSPSVEFSDDGSFIENKDYINKRR